MLTQGESVEAHALRERGWSVSAIARHLGRDRKTIRAYLSGEREPGRRKPAGPDPFARFGSYCEIRFGDDPHLWATTLCDEVADLGYEGAYQSFTRELRKRGLRPGCERCATAGGPEEFAVIAHPAGGETQWDWVELPDPPPAWGQGKTAHLLVGALSHSRARRGAAAGGAEQPDPVASAGGAVARGHRGRQEGDGAGAGVLARELLLRPARPRRDRGHRPAPARRRDARRGHLGGHGAGPAPPRARPRRRGRPRRRARRGAGEEGAGRPRAGRAAVQPQGAPSAVGRGPGRGRRDPRRCGRRGGAGDRFRGVGRRGTAAAPGRPGLTGRPAVSGEHSSGGFIMPLVPVPAGEPGSEAKRSEMKRSETEIPEALMTAMTTVAPAGGSRCKRSGCAAPLPRQESGRSRQFCSDECRRRHYNALRGTPPAVLPAPAEGPGPALARLGQLLAEAGRLAAPAARPVAAARAAGEDGAAGARALAGAAAGRGERAGAALAAERAARRALPARLAAAPPARARPRAAAGSGT